MSAPVSAPHAKPDGQAEPPVLFVEVNPFHAETLWMLVTTHSRGPADLVLGPAGLLQQDLVAALPVSKGRFSWRRLLTEVRSGRGRRCYLNTISFTLYPINRWIVKDNLSIVLTAVAARLAGCHLDGVMHEADQFFDTGVFASRRQKWFQRVVGWWWVKLFDQLFVLSPEVQRHLERHGVRTTLLDSTKLRDFGRTGARPSEHDPRPGTLLVWVGPVDETRRASGPLLSLLPDVLERCGAAVAVIGDSREASGPAFRAAVEAKGLAPYFIFFDRRPSDLELFDWVARSTAVLCLYSSAVYGTIKTSGARVWAGAFRKPFVSTQPRMGVYDWDGVEQISSDDINVCVAALAEAPAPPAPRR
jgi:hypothetical protein